MRKLRKWLGRLLSSLHPTSHRDPEWGASQARKSTAGETWPRGVASAARRLLWPKLGRGSIRVGGSFRRRVARKGTSEAPLLNEIKEEALDPPGINATIQADIEAAEMQRIPGSNVVPRAQRRRSRRVSVMSQTTRHKKVSYRKKRKTFTFLRRKKQVERRRKPSALTIVKLQTQMDGLVETMADCSVKLLAKRQAELEHCKRMGDRVADASRHFQRSTSKGSRRRRWRNACVLCSCCC